MADSIKVVVLENDFAALCRLGLPVSLSLQLQQSGLKLADALWTARSSGSGFSVSLFWPSDIRTSKRGRRKGKAVKTVKKDNKKARKNTKVLATTSVTSAATATAANQPETPINAQQPILCGNSAEVSHPAEVSVSLTTTAVTPQHGNLQNIKSSPSISLQNCDEVSYEKKDDIHGVSYTDENGLAGWTPVVGRKKKKRCHLSEMFLRRFPPEARLRHANHSDSSSDSSGSDQDLDHLIPTHAAVTFSFDEDMQPDLSIKTRSIQQWTPIAARTRAKLRNS